MEADIWAVDIPGQRTVIFGHDISSIDDMLSCPNHNFVVHLSPVHQLKYIELYATISAGQAHRAVHVNPSEWIAEWNFNLKFFDELANMIDAPEPFHFYIFIKVSFDSEHTASTDQREIVQNNMYLGVQTQMPCIQSRGILRILFLKGGQLYNSENRYTLINEHVQQYAG